MSLTSIGPQKTPGRPIEITFAAELGLPSDQKTVLLIGHKDATSGSASAYAVTTINATTDQDAAETEAAEKFGAGSELAKMVVAAVKANQDAGRSTFPALKCIALPSEVNDFGPAEEALDAARATPADYIVSPYDAMDAELRGDIEALAQSMSGAQRVHNYQFGSCAFAANRNTADPSNLDSPDSQYFNGIYLRDSGSPEYSLGEVAAAVAAVAGSNVFPFNPQHGFVVGGLAAPEDMSDWISVGGGLESETVLNKGWTPLRVLPNGDVAIVRMRTSRITTGDGVTLVTGYYDLTDFDVLYYWRKTVFTRLNQPDLVNVKASIDTAKLIKSELIRLASVFESNQAFQNVKELAKKFKVERSASDRHRFDTFTPVNVIPGLAVVANNTQATTEGDELSI